MTSCRIPARPFDYRVKAGQPARIVQEEDRYTKRRNHDAISGCGFLPDDFDPSAEDEAMSAIST